MEEVMKDIMKGVVLGVSLTLGILLMVLLFRFFNERNRKIYEMMEAQNEIQEMREDVINRDAAEFLDEPGVRGAADRARDEYYRKLDEILQRYGSERSD
jgi:hypothetical protein